MSQLIWSQTAPITSPSRSSIFVLISIPVIRWMDPRPKHRASIFRGSFMGTNSSGCHSRPNQPPNMAPQIVVEIPPKKMTRASCRAKPVGLNFFKAMYSMRVSTSP